MIYYRIAAWINGFTQSQRSAASLLGVWMMFSCCQADAATPEVVTTIPELARIAEAVGGNNIVVHSLMPVGQNPHLYSPRPSHAELLTDCALLFTVGYKFEESWLPGLIRLSGNRAIRPGEKAYMSGADAIESVLPFASVSPQASANHNRQTNAYWWLDPRLAAIVALSLSTKLEAIDPFNAAHYRERSRAFAIRIAEAMPKWQSLMQINVGPVLCYHSNYLYFMDAMGIEPAGFIEPKPGIEPSTRHLTQLLRIIRQRGIKMIWIASYDHRGGRRATG